MTPHAEPTPEFQGFADLEEPLVAFHRDPAPVTPRTVNVVNVTDDSEGFIEVCDKCRGTGTFRGYSRLGRECFKCKGAGKFVRKTSPEQRAKAKARAVQAKAHKAADAQRAVQTWVETHAAEFAWIKTASARGFNFADAMALDLNKYGRLTDNQLAAVQRFMAKDAERDATRAAERAQRDATAPSIDVARIEESFATAFSNGAKKPALRLDVFKFSPAPATGRNAGSIYVKQGDEYLGKVQGGKFHRAFTCNAETAEKVVAVASDPKAAAVAYGARTGSCSCCGRELSDPVSIEMGIGPVCASKYGW